MSTQLLIKIFKHFNHKKIPTLGDCKLGVRFKKDDQFKSHKCEIANLKKSHHIIGPACFFLIRSS